VGNAYAIERELGGGGVPRMALATETRPQDLNIVPLTA
jgi:hypothetical protein